MSMESDYIFLVISNNSFAKMAVKYAHGGSCRNFFATGS